MYGRTALHYAAMFGHTECVRLLVNACTYRNEKFCQIDAQAHDGMTPLMDACDSLPSEECKQCIKILCEHKANTKVTEIQGYETALHIAIKRMPDLAVVKWLVRSWKDSVLDLIDMPWATVKKRSRNSNPISLMTRDSKSDPMICLFLSESYIWTDDETKRTEINAGVVEVAKYFAKLGFVENALRSVLAGNIQKPELLKEVVERFLEKGSVLETNEILENMQFRPAALSLYAQKSIIFLEGLPTSFEPDDYHTHLYNAFLVLIIQGWVSGTVPLKAVKKLHDTLKLEPYWGVGESLPPNFEPLETLYTMTETPPMLRQLARTKIRTQMAKCNKFCRENLRKLPLPEVLKEYVQLTDLGDGSEAEKIMKRVKGILSNNVGH